MSANVVRAGTIENASVGEALRLVLDRFEDSACVVLRSLDSYREVDDLVHCMEHGRYEFALVHRNVCLSLQTVRARLDTLFEHFDEVWLFRGAPPAVSLELVPHSTSDSKSFVESVPPEVLEALSRSGCVLLLADGCGLNYATTDEAIERAIAVLNVG